MFDTERLSRLISELAADDGYQSGLRRLPLAITPNDAADIARALASEVDRGAAAREASTARKRLPIVCEPRCNACCEEPVLVFFPEALAIARFLKRSENAWIRAKFLEAYVGWKERTGTAPIALGAAYASGDRVRYLRERRELWRRGVLCPFNHDSLCTIYEVRPLACRNVHAVETRDRCSAACGSLPHRIDFEPLDDFIVRAERVLSSLHNALGAPRSRPAALPDAIAFLLQREEIAQAAVTR